MGYWHLETTKDSFEGSTLKELLEDVRGSLDAMAENRALHGISCSAPEITSACYIRSDGESERDLTNHPKVEKLQNWIVDYIEGSVEAIQDGMDYREEVQSYWNATRL